MALTTLARVKQYGQIDSEDTSSDDLLTWMIDAASAAIEQYCSRKFEQERKTEVRDGTNTRTMMLSRFPVANVHGVTINSQTVPVRTSALGSGYTFDDVCVKLTGYTFESGVDNVTIDYTGGLATVPNDVALACCEVVMLRYKARDRMGVSSKSLAGETISFTLDDFPDYVTRVLNQYVIRGLP